MKRIRSNTTAWVWFLSIVVLAIALTIAAVGNRAPRTTGERVERLAATIKCPTCAGQSVAQSEAPASRDIRADLERRIAEGESDNTIRQAMATRFGPDILLSPSPHGIVGLVWLLPVVAFLGCATGLGVAFVRWRAQRPGPPSDSDRELVAAAINDRQQGG